MEKVKCIIAKRTSREITGKEFREFNAYDNKGRQFGARVAKLAITFEDAEVELWNYPGNLINANDRRRPAGTYYGFCPQALRDGDVFGACQHDHIFTNEAERDAAIEKYFVGAEKRALNNKAAR